VCRAQQLKRGGVHVPHPGGRLVGVNAELGCVRNCPRPGDGQDAVLLVDDRPELFEALAAQRLEGRPRVADRSLFVQTANEPLQSSCMRRWASAILVGAGAIAESRTVQPTKNQPACAPTPRRHLRGNGTNALSNAIRIPLGDDGLSQGLQTNTTLGGGQT
jgi:hypothetical protein